MNFEFLIIYNMIFKEDNVMAYIIEDNYREDEKTKKGNLRIVPVVPFSTAVRCCLLLGHYNRTVTFRIADVEQQKLDVVVVFDQFTIGEIGSGTC